MIWTGCRNAGVGRDGGVEELSEVASSPSNMHGGRRSRQNHELLLRHVESEVSFPHSQM